MHFLGDVLVDSLVANPGVPWVEEAANDYVVGALVVDSDLLGAMIFVILVDSVHCISVYDAVVKPIWSIDAVTLRDLTD